MLTIKSENVNPEFVLQFEKVLIELEKDSSIKRYE
jgi:hypothetical protein